MKLGHLLHKILHANENKWTTKLKTRQNTYIYGATSEDSDEALGGEGREAARGGVSGMLVIF